MVQALGDVRWDTKHPGPPPYTQKWPETGKAGEWKATPPEKRPETREVPRNFVISRKTVKKSKQIFIVYIKTSMSIISFAGKLGV